MEPNPGDQSAQRIMYPIRIIIWTPSAPQECTKWVDTETYLPGNGSWFLMYVARNAVQQPRTNPEVQVEVCISTRRW